MRALRVDPSDSTPIWSQIEEGVRRLVASGSLPAGSAMPSVRELAGDLSVNPATVAKAYQKLTDAGILTVKRGEGTYVTEKPPSLPRNERARTLRDGAARYASLAVTVGANEREASRELGAVWKEFDEGTGRAAS
ncbi:MAG TPA: GntR family transcriptional regulator [Thermoanaerobaculia bacterium]